MTRPLLERFPALSIALPYVELANLPTRVSPLPSFGAAIGVSNLFIKRDDLTGTAYGGNKVRKLEFLLADALRKGAREVMTFGFAGSNHATATAIYAQQVGLRSISMLLPQPNSRWVCRNLLKSFQCGAELHLYGSKRMLKAGVVIESTRHRMRSGKWPQLIPSGGSTPLGIMGIVNAVFELASQIKAGMMPVPDRIYVAVGSMGTAAGILIGLALAQMNTRVEAVRVIDSSLANRDALDRMVRETIAFMGERDQRIPSIMIEPGRLSFRDAYFGEQYALYTVAGMEAIALLGESEGIRLDGTYTGKAMAALVDDARSGAIKGETVLFWDTFNSRPFWETMPSIDYHQLPRTLHHYFEDPVQPLDA